MKIEQLNEATNVFRKRYDKSVFPVFLKKQHVHLHPHDVAINVVKGTPTFHKLLRSGDIQDTKLFTEKAVYDIVAQMAIMIAAAEDNHMWYDREYLGWIMVEVLDLDLNRLFRVAEEMLFRNDLLVVRMELRWREKHRNTSNDTRYLTQTVIPEIKKGLQSIKTYIVAKKGKIAGTAKPAAPQPKPSYSQPVTVAPSAQPKADISWAAKEKKPEEKKVTIPVSTPKPVKVEPKTKVESDIELPSDLNNWTYELTGDETDMDIEEIHFALANHFSLDVEERDYSPTIEGRTFKVAKTSAMGKEYDADGYDERGYDEMGYDRNGEDVFGFNDEGYNDEGMHMDGHDFDGYFPNGTRSPFFEH